jgi:26S proteasome non-ATPase regulatory subunit 9
MMFPGRHGGVAGELRELNRQREAMEAELTAITEALGADNMGGVSGALIDREGFPRADIDVHGTRTLRHRLACLTTDHRALMQLLEAKLHALHTATAGEGGARASAPAPRYAAAAPSPSDASPMANGGAESMASFARIASITAGGPAALAGLRQGDELVRYAHLDATNHDNLRGVARLTGRSEGGFIPLAVRRASKMVEVTLAPQRWEGPGLLGCHLVPM